MVKFLMQTECHQFSNGPKQSSSFLEISTEATISLECPLKIISIARRNKPETLHTPTPAVLPTLLPLSRQEIEERVQKLMKRYR